MINVSEQLKNILKNDRFPMSDTSIPKDLEIIFDGVDPIYADQVVDDSFELTESIIADDDIRFGTCRASQIKFKLANVSEELKGREFAIDQLIGDSDIVPLGKFKVESAKLEDDLIFKELVAYDKLQSIDVDVSAWYNGLFPTGSETYTLKQFRSSLLAYLGIEEIDQTLPNDDMIVEKTIDPTQISGRTVLEATVELNGAFGHINRQGKFVRIVLQPSYGLYPSETLYPSEDLFPVAESDTSYVQEDIVADTVSKAMYESVRFEEYAVKEIDKLQIRAEENDIGAIVGTGTNTYVIEGNFLVFGKSASELEQIALNAFGNMAKRPYRPYGAQSIGLPYIEVGDSLEIATDDTVVGYVLQRTLTGIQALRDEFEAPGSEEREQNFGVNKEIIQLQGKAARIQKDVDGVRVEVEDLEQDTASKFEQTATQIFAEVSRATGAEGELDSKITQTAESITQEVTRATEAEGTLSGSIEALAGQVVLKVDADGNIATVKLEADPTAGTSFKVKADNISLEGLTTINGKFKILEDGSIETVDGTFSGKIVGGEISGVNFISSAWDGSSYGSWYDDVDISGGEIRLGRTFYATDGQTSENATTIRFNMINTRYVYADNVGTSDDKILDAYITNARVDKLYVDGVGFKPKSINTLYASDSSNPYKVTLNTSGQLVPADATYDLGNGTYPWNNFYAKNIYQNGKLINTLYANSSSSIFLNASREFVPSSNSTSYPYSIGNLTYPWAKGYFKELYLNGALLSPLTAKEIKALYATGTYYAEINKSREFVPNTNSTSLPFDLGNSNYPWTDLHIKNIYHKYGSLGLFGKEPIAQKTVTKLSTTADNATVLAKVNELLDALGNATGYGLVKL